MGKGVWLMQKRKLNNRGFSLIELIIVVVILVVLVGLLAPQFMKFVEKAKRVKDANTALEVRNAFDRVLIFDPSFLYTGVSGSSIYRPDNGNYVCILDTDGSGAPYITEPLILAVLDDLGSYPIASTYKSGLWVIEIDKTYSSVARVEILELTPTGPPVSGGQFLGFEVWPNSRTFCSGAAPYAVDTYNHMAVLP